MNFTNKEIKRICFWADKDNFNSKEEFLNFRDKYFSQNIMLNDWFKNLEKLKTEFNVKLKIFVKDNTINSFFISEKLSITSNYIIDDGFEFEL